MCQGGSINDQERSAYIGTVVQYSRNVLIMGCTSSVPGVGLGVYYEVLRGHVHIYSVGI